MPTIHTQPETELVTESASPSVQQETVLPNTTPWKVYQKVLFRLAFIFFVIMSIPWNGEWYTNLFSLDWTSLHYRDLYDIARFSPSFVRGWGLPSLNGYADWIFVLILATVGGLIWTAIDRKTKEYNLLYYWLRVIVRYRAGIGIIGFGFTKLLPVQMPYPSLGLLNTDLGDFTAQKIYWLSIGIVPWYQVFAGVVEISAGILLFFRRTTTFGAILLFGALGDILYVNFAYDGGVHVYSSYFVLYAAFLLIYDIPKLYNLLILEQFTVPVHFYPSFSKQWLKYSRTGLKAFSIFLFVGVLFYLQLVNFLYDPYKQPATKGITALRGNYTVTEFRLNNQIIPYSPLDSVRWQEVTFEKWTTLTYKVNRPVELDLSNGGGSPMRDINRTFELTGVAGGRRMFYYEADTVNQVLFLQDKNRGVGNRENGENARSRREGIAKQEKKPAQNWIPATSLAYIGNEDERIDPKAISKRRTKGIAQEAARDGERRKMILNYLTNDGSRVILTGIDENRDSLYIVLDKIDRKYVLSESTLEAGKYE